ncbi:pyridoxal phosphate-dependent transferase [Fusarium avenaceum]|nr:pyridoxal phosphate-dependent transferase [Fusarium avenaceum]
MSSPHGYLSKRGDVFAMPTNKMPQLEILCDLWHPETNPDGCISLGVAENTLMHKELIEHMTKNFTVDSHSLTCGDGFSGSHRLRNTLARFINRNFHAHEPVTKKELIVTSGAGQAIELIGFSLCDPGDGVLLARPHYGNFPIDLGFRAQAKVVRVSFGDVDPLSLETVDIYEKALMDAQSQGIRVRAFLLCNPHNPLGRCYTREVLKAYMRFCEKHGLHLISDEVYALSVWKNPEVPHAPGFTSILAMNPDNIIDRNLIHVIWGMSKDFGSNGIKIGCLITRNEALMSACEANSYFSGPSSLSDLTTSHILSDDTFIDSFVKTNRLRLANNYLATTLFLEDHQIPYKKGSNAGLFVWADLFQPIRSEINAILQKEVAAGKTPDQVLWGLEEKLQETLLAHKIFLARGADFGSDVPGWFRIVFAHEKAYLLLGLGRIVKAIETFRQT